MARIEPPNLKDEAKLFLVEGQNDKHVVWQICRHHTEIPDFYIADRGNSQGVLDSIVPEALSPARMTLGVLLDMDDDPQSRWDEVAYQLRLAGIRPPIAPDSAGTIITAGNGKPRVGVWLMPNNESSGELEDFVARMIPNGDTVWPLARGYIDHIAPSDRKFAAGKTLRAQLYSWLAVREDPRQMGLAIRAKDLETDGELCRQFIDWLSRLFG